MPFTSEISSKNPMALIFLIDQSSSMNNFCEINSIGAKKVPISYAVSDVINSTIEEIINRCQKSEGVMDYFNVAVIGYGRNDCTNLLLKNNFSGNFWCKPSDLKNNYLEAKTIKQEVVIRGRIYIEEHHQRIWIKPIANGKTLMKKALILSKELLEEWVKDHEDSFPPIIFNIVGSKVSDVNNFYELIEIAKDIKQIKTNDGNVLLFNCHISNNNNISPVIFPESEVEILDGDFFSYILFVMSSDIPEIFFEDITEIFGKNSPYIKGKCMAYNSNISSMIRLIDIGTRAAKAATTHKRFENEKYLISVNNNTNKNEKKIFICYAREDKLVAQKIYYDLKKFGVTPWIDIETLLPGQRWKHEIRKAINECSFFVSLLSTNSISKSGFVQKELKMAFEILDNTPDSKIFIIPIRLEKCQPIDNRLSELHWVDLFPSYDKALKQIQVIIDNDYHKKI